jgi:DNA polymerase III epsilon subunit-like protein
MYGSGVYLSSRFGTRPLDQELAIVRTRAPGKLRLAAALAHHAAEDDELISPQEPIATIWHSDRLEREKLYTVYLNPPDAMSHDGGVGQARRQTWAQSILTSPDAWVILDIETTGRMDDADVIEIAGIDLRGQQLFAMLVCPPVLIPAAITDLTGISNEMVGDVPGLETIYEQIAPLVAERRVLVYNVDFDLPCLERCVVKSGVAWRQVSSACLMEAYAEYRGRRHPQGHRFAGQYVWQSLAMACEQMGVAGHQTHRALDDCQRALALLLAMSRGETPADTAH